MWSLCNIEETIIKAKEDAGSKEQAFAIMAKWKGKLGNLVHEEQTKKYMSKIQWYGFQEYGHYKQNCIKVNKDNNNERKREEAHVTQ